MTSRSERLLRLVALFCFGAVGVALISSMRSTCRPAPGA